MSVSIEPPAVLFPDVFISSSSSFPIKIVNKENIRKTVFLSNEKPKKKRKIEKEIDIYDPKARSCLNTANNSSDSTFSFSDEKIELWPLGTKQIFINFTPKMAKVYEKTVYLYTEDRSFIHPLKIKGKSLPPRASFLTDCIQIGRVGLGSVFNYEVEFRNNGSAEIDFELEKKDHNGLVFEFSPSKGHLGIEEKVKISVRFEASRVCNFNEVCTFKIAGLAEKHPNITFIGKVIGPTFTITPTMLDFGDVGYGFLYSKVVTIENKSNIPFDFNFVVRNIDSSKRRDYQIFPDSGHLNSFDKKEITIEFIPSTIQQYDLCIDFNVENYKDSISVIHVLANCVSPELTLDSDVLDFGNIFIGHNYTKEIKINNDTTFGATFDFNGTDYNSNKIGILTSGKENGIIKPMSSISVPISLTGQTLGEISLDCYFMIYGATYPPLHLTVKALCVGPTIVYSMNTVNFGNINILKEKTKELLIENKSLIPANFKANIEQQSPIFQAPIVEGIIEPNESITFPISATVNDVLQYQGKIKFSFSYLNPHAIPLKACGIGTPIISSIEMKNIDLGYLLTKQLSITRFTLTNVSQRKYEVRLSNTKPHVPKDSNAVVKFSVKPDFISLEPNEEVEVELHAFCDSVVSFTIQVNCDTTVKKTRSEVYNTHIKGTFIDPMVSFSTNCLEFRQNTIQKEVSLETISPNFEIMSIQQKELTLTNNCKLPLDVVANCPAPFSLVNPHFVIEPNQSIVQQIIFDPSFKEDYITETVTKKLTFSFDDHPQELFVTLKGIISFPNIEFNTDTNIDFGVMMENTESTKTIAMRNVFENPLQYKWEIIGSNEILKVFDAFPIRGIIEPMESIDTHFSFYAKPGDDKSNKKYECVAVCHVSNGPDYTFNISGTSASIEYRIEPKEFNLQNVNLLSTSNLSTNIENFSRVPLTFRVKIPRRTLFSTFTAYPMTGSIPPGSSQEIKVTVVPGSPKKFREQWSIQIGKFEDTQMLIIADSEFSQALINLPRSSNDSATKSLINKKEIEMREFLQRSSAILPTIVISDDEDEDSTTEYRFSDEELLAEEKNIVASYFSKQKTLPMRLQRQTTDQSQILSDAPPISEYILDFEDVVFGEVMTKTFSIKNCASFDIGFDVDSSALKRTGFKFEQISFANIPSGESVDVDVTFNITNMKNSIEGPVEFNVPIKFNDCHKTNIIIRGNMKPPKLIISQPNFEFGNVVIGQTKIMTLQLQNANEVNCQFEFEQPQIYETIRKMNGEEVEEIQNLIFNVIPATGVIQPSSFCNIALQFSPQSSKSYQKRLLLKLKYSQEPISIDVSGTGIKLMLNFTPNELELPPVLPFSGPSVGSFVVSNPTQLPVDFLSLQFDSQLTAQEESNLRDMDSPFVTYTPKIRVPASTSKINACIIVDGPPFCGKTTLCNTLSKEYNLPIISLEKTDSINPEDTVKHLMELFSNEEYRNGFIIDGYNFVNDQADEQFIQQCIKQKKDCIDDILVHKNAVYQTVSPSTAQQMSELIIKSLEGHYVFHISMNMNDEKVLERQERMERRKRKEERKAKRAEGVYLMTMTEEYYQSLSPEEQEEVDRKRAEFRKIPKDDEPKKTNRGKKGKEVKGKELKNASEKQRESKVDKKKSKPGVFSNPLQTRTFAYLLSVGSINQKLSKSKDHFKVIDPAVITQKKGLSGVIGNTIIVDATKSRNDVVKDVEAFLPKLNILKEYISKELIPPPSTIDNNATTDLMRLSSKIPRCFYLNNEGESHSTQRWHLEPGSEMTLNVYFDSKIGNGSFNDTLLFAIEGSSSPPIQLKVSCQCSNPVINMSPRHLFQSLRAKDKLGKYPIFNKDTGVIDFGFSLPQKDKAAKICSAFLTLENPGKFPAELSFVTDGNPKQSIWHLDSTATVLPNEPQQFEISFVPTAFGEFETPLTIFTKDNPDIHKFKLFGICCNPSLEVNPQTIDFDKRMINQEGIKKLELKNTGKVAVYWRLKNVNNLGGLITFTANEGCIQPKSSFNLLLKFVSSKPTLLKKPFSIEVLDAENTRVFDTINVPVQAEAFDVLFDVQIQSKNNESDHLDFGLMKVGQSKQLTIGLKNRGKYNVIYEIDTDPKLKKILQFTPNKGVVSPSDKNAAIQCQFNGARSLKCNIASGVTITLIDAQTKTVTAVLKYAVIAQAAYSSYQLSCLKKLSFGTCSNTSPVQKEIILKNTGLFPIDFDFKMKDNGTNAENDPKKGHTSLPPIKGSKGKKVQNVQPVGPFSLNPLSGTIHVGQSAKIICNYDTQVPGMKISQWILNVPSVSPSEVNSVIKISGCSYSPSLSMSSTDKIFPKVPMCLRVDLNKKDINCFVEDEQTVHFSPKIVGKKDSIPFVIKNAQPVDCNIEISVKSKNKGQCPFDIADKITTVPAHKSIPTSINFQPSGCDFYQAVIEINVKGLTPQVFRYPVEGYGALPSMSLVTQLEKTKTAMICNMGRTLVNNEKQKEIVFVNETKISAKVSLNISSNPDFVIQGPPSSGYTCEPGAQLKILVNHIPQNPRKSQVDITLTVADNPKFSIPFSVVGEGYSEDVQFDNIGDDNDLHFPDAIVGKSQQVSFSIRNVSNSALKFVLNSTNEVQFVPKVGHLKKHQIKDITATFFSDKPVKMQPGKASLQITKIILEDDELDWDDSKKMISFVKRSVIEAPAPTPVQKGHSSRNQKAKIEIKPKDELVKVNTVVPEPKFKIVPGTKPRDIPLKVYVISDQIKYTFDTNEISFAPTMMYQTRTAECKLTNTCGVRIEYNWEISSFEALRSDYAKKFEPPFVVTPKAGFIEPGQCQPFDVVFAPLEVDDFQCKFTCKVLYSASENPYIDINALSRRPLCHFNIQTSDYLQHRHPDYVYQLPENVRVVEFFSKSPGTRSVNKIEMINPTADAYETIWTKTSLTQDKTIRCDSKRSLVSSGKHYTFQFTFTPRSPNLVESLWEFEIPKYNVKVPFLFVGRIQH